MAKRLYDLREQANHSQEGIAAAAGVTQVTWSNWEKDPPSQFKALARIATKYGVSADYLLGITDDPSPRRGEALPAPVQEVVGLAVAWPDARQQELLAHAQVLNAAQRAANLGEYDRLMAMFAAAEDGPVLVAMIDDLLRAIDAGNAAAVRLLLGRIAEGRGAAVQQPQQAGEQA
ncbi:MAG: helix-turn-helix transcriptional regulator [Caldilineaceae bacterium]|nr:helix-turn-helix transcriptional regulator [Caldilineaceae bacterium]